MTFAGGRQSKHFFCRNFWKKNTFVFVVFFQELSMPAIKKLFSKLRDSFSGGRKKNNEKKRRKKRICTIIT